MNEKQQEIFTAALLLERAIDSKNAAAMKYHLAVDAFQKASDEMDDADLLVKRLLEDIEIHRKTFKKLVGE